MPAHPAETIHRQISEILSAWGMPPDVVRTAAGVMTDTDLAGIDSHGISMLMLYEEALQLEQLNPRPVPRVVRETAVTALLDGDAGLGHVSAVMGMELAIEKARANGVGVVSVRNSTHFGAAGYYAAMASARGLLGLVTCTTRGNPVLPTRSAVPVLGTNPIAFSAPTRRNQPFLLDMSTSTVAQNKVKIFDFQRRPLPAGWVLDDAGRPVTDSARAMDLVTVTLTGGITALGGTAEMSSHKGYGLSVMVQILSATLAGGSFTPIRKRTQGRGDPDEIGHFLMALDPTAFRDPGEFEDDLDDVIDVLHAARATDPGEPVLVAGEPEAIAREERSRTGIPIPDALGEKIRAICERCGAPFLLDA
ncbi:MAG TPA: Ldh family oxidoreductase [Gemmatimonadaceae bacterium]|jgi:LDH2 family malate/lactate/ureidoglycolate dehydrogenase|nr:Ldh family oxidoreductase [Gemmatimonadaceae bacterium]